MDLFTEPQLVDLSSPSLTGDMIFNKQHTSASTNTCTTYTQTITGDPWDVTCTKTDTQAQSRTVSFNTPRSQWTEGNIYDVPQSISTPRVWEPLHLQSSQSEINPVRESMYGARETHTGYAHAGVMGEPEQIMSSIGSHARYYHGRQMTRNELGFTPQHLRSAYPPTHYTTGQRPLETNNSYMTNRSGLHSSLPLQNNPAVGVEYISARPVLGNTKVFEPETFSGDPAGTEWSEYIIHFEMIADLNAWTDYQRTRVLLSKLRGKAQTILTSLTYEHYNDYTSLKRALTQRFNPEEREIAHRCEFKNRRRQKNEQPADFGYALQRLGRKAYPSMPYSSLEIHILDQFIMGLGSFELQKHVQFHHPKTLEQAINLATEYVAMCKNLDRIEKPSLVEEREVTQTEPEQRNNQMNSLRPMSQQQANFDIETLETIIKRVVQQSLKELNLPEQSENRPNNNKGFNNRYNRPYNYKEFNQEPNRNSEPTKDLQENEFGNKQQGPRKISCTYCGKDNHVESRCRIKQRDKNNQQTQVKKHLN